MNSDISEYLNFNASHIISVELKPEIAANCKLRSNFVHEKLLETKNNLSGNPLLLKLCNKGLKFLNPDSHALIMAHSIHRISYTACDRSSCQFAMVARSTENGNAQFCHIVRMHSSEEADTINRYIGSLFKNLNLKRKSKKSEGTPKHTESTQKPTEDNSAQTNDSQTRLRPTNNVYDDLDTRLRRISTPHIDELVSEKHYVRRLSLCIPSPGAEDPAVIDVTQNLHSSLEKKPSNSHCVPQSIDNKPLLRKKSEYKTNKISAVMERLSFRASRDLSADILKSGSPVVALKEQLESFDRSGDEHKSAFSSNLNSVALSQSKKRLPPSLNDPTNCWKMAALSRKNSAPLPLEQVPNNVNPHEEQPPVPPVRINSLRNPIQHRPVVLVDESPLVRCKGESSIQQGALDQDDHLSSITTPSSCEDNIGDSSIEDYRTQHSNKMNFSASFNDSQYRAFNHNNFSHDGHHHNSSLPMNYFKNFCKDETTDYLMNKELGSFILRNSASHKGCFALSVKVSDISVSHYIVQSSSSGYQIKGLDKSWPSLHSLITHLSVIPEMLPCPLQIQPIATATIDSGLDRKMSTPSFVSHAHQAELPVHIGNNLKKQALPQSKSADEEYQHRMRQFLNDSLIPGQEQYQQLSDFSSMIASFDLN